MPSKARPRQAVLLVLLFSVLLFTAASDASPTASVEVSPNGDATPAAPAVAPTATAGDDVHRFFRDSALGWTHSAAGTVDDATLALMDWFAAEGGVAPGVAPALFENPYYSDLKMRGMVATDPRSVGDIIAATPGHLLLTSQSPCFEKGWFPDFIRSHALDPLVRHLDGPQLLVIHGIVEMSSPDSFRHPYFASLPGLDAKAGAASASASAASASASADRASVGSVRADAVFKRFPDVFPSDVYNAASYQHVHDLFKSRWFSLDVDPSTESGLPGTAGTITRPTIGLVPVVDLFNHWALAHYSHSPDGVAEIPVKWGMIPDGNSSSLAHQTRRNARSALPFDQWAALASNDDAATALNKTELHPACNATRYREIMGRTFTLRSGMNLRVGDQALVEYKLNGNNPTMYKTYGIVEEDLLSDLVHIRSLSTSMLDEFLAATAADRNGSLTTHAPFRIAGMPPVDDGTCAGLGRATERVCTWTKEHPFMAVVFKGHQVPSNLMRSCRRWAMTEAEAKANNGACHDAVALGSAISRANEERALECVLTSIRISLHIVHLKFADGPLGGDANKHAAASSDSSAFIMATKDGGGWHVHEGDILDNAMPAADRSRVVFRVEQKSLLLDLAQMVAKHKRCLADDVLDASKCEYAQHAYRAHLDALSGSCSEEARDAADLAVDRAAGGSGGSAGGDGGVTAASQGVSPDSHDIVRPLGGSRLGRLEDWAWRQAEFYRMCEGSPPEDLAASCAHFKPYVHMQMERLSLALRLLIHDDNGICGLGQLWWAEHYTTLLKKVDTYTNSPRGVAFAAKQFVQEDNLGDIFRLLGQEPPPNSALVPLLPVQWKEWFKVAFSCIAEKNGITDVAYFDHMLPGSGRARSASESTGNANTVDLVNTRFELKKTGTRTITGPRAMIMLAQTHAVTLCAARHLYDASTGARQNGAVVAELCKAFVGSWGPSRNANDTEGAVYYEMDAVYLAVATGNRGLLEALVKRGANVAESGLWYEGERIATALHAGLVYPLAKNLVRIFTGDGSVDGGAGDDGGEDGAGAETSAAEKMALMLVR